MFAAAEGSKSSKLYVAITNDGDVGIGTSDLSAGLKLNVEGKIGATHICDQSGGNCKDISECWGITCSDCGTCWDTYEHMAGQYKYWRMCTPAMWKQTSPLLSA